jgi:transposase
MLKAIAEGETNPATLAALADERLRATTAQLCDALGACTELNPVYRRLVSMALEELRLINEQIVRLDQEMAGLLKSHQDAVERLAEVPGLGVDSAQQIIAEVGPTAAAFPSGKCLASWVGVCPGTDETAGVNYSPRSPKGNRQMRRLLNQAAMPAPGPKEVSVKSYIAGWSRDWDTIRQSAPLPSTMPPDLADPASGSTIRRTRLRAQQTIEATPYLEDDPGTPKPRIPNRTTRF